MLNNRIPPRRKKQLKQAWWAARAPTARWRALPDFIVIGAQKAGTTSLFRYLCAQPAVARPFGQEPVFFSHEISTGEGSTTIASISRYEPRSWSARRVLT